MKRILLLTLALLLTVIPLIPVAAQSGPGEGGIIIEPNIGDDVATLNPILYNDVNSARVSNLLFPNLYAIDPITGVFTPGAPGSLAIGWELSDDGLSYTFTLRDDWNWSDDTPITAQDWVYAYDVIASGQTTSPRATALPFIESVEAVDDYTLVINMTSAACNALNNMSGIRPLPHHVIQEQIGDDLALFDDMDFNLNPTVTAGPFKFASFNSGSQVALEADQNYPYASPGFVRPTGFIYKNVPDTNVALEQFLAGELNVYINAPPESYPELRALGETGEIQTFEFAATNYNWIAFNLANPDNPQDGVDEDGNIIEQDPHPIFGDVRVRQALIMALDIDSIIEAALGDTATRVNTHTIPTSWAYDPDYTGFAFDPDAALALLAEAGWVDDDDDPSTPLVATEDALYAEAGTPLEFDMTSDAGDAVRETFGTFAQDQWGQIGVKVNFTPVDFNVAIEQLIGQTFDASVLWWQMSYPFDPDFGWAFNPVNDVVGGGLNFVSYNNPEVTALLDQANNVAGCSLETRKPMYVEAQRMLGNDAPYAFLFSPNITWVAQGNVEGWNPLPNQLYWDVSSWDITGG